MAEALVGGAFLSASLQVLFDRLASPEVLAFLQGKKRSDKLLCKLKIKLLAVQAVLDDAEEKQIINTHVKEWVDELKHAVYDAEDLLDEIAAKALPRKMESDSQTIATQVRSIINSGLNLFSQRINSRVERITEKLELLAQEKDVLGLKEGVQKLSRRWPATSLVDESGVYGRVDDKGKIIEFLLADNPSGNRIGVIALVGMGGIGKTTLAQLVYNDSRVEECFDLKAWVCVSDEFDLVRITKAIVKSIGISDDGDLNQLQVKLKERLSTKKFLVVLDDVWNEKFSDWDKLQTPFTVGLDGSKIIVTTRSVKVASVMRSVHTHHLERLSFEDCWSLFARHAFENGDYGPHPKLEEIGKEIVKKCKGLPLAAKTLGGALYLEIRVEEWEYLLNNDTWNSMNDEVLPALRLSYSFLPSHLKRCFAYCSIFPKDYEFKKENLILLWMAEGFLQQSEGNKTMEKVGDGYFDDLLSRSFFQKSSSHKSCFVMHDLISDLAQLVSGKFCVHLKDWRINEIPDKARHLSYSVSKHDTFRRYGIPSNVTALRTFLPLPGPLPFEESDMVSKLQRPCGYGYSQIRSDRIPNSLLQKVQYLRVLSLCYCGIIDMPEAIGNLKHLRCLDLSYTSIKRLPESVCNLCNLQTLRLTFCKDLVKLPTMMHKLAALRHLDIRHCNVQRMPSQMGKLTSLQKLTNYRVGKNSGTGIKELRELSYIGGILHIEELQNVADGRDALEGNLVGKQYLDDLRLEWSHNVEQNGADIVLNHLQPHSNLKRLAIEGYGGLKFPDWLGGPTILINMVSLRLWRCENVSAFPPLGQLPSLKHLYIWELEGIIRVGTEFYGTEPSFVSLKALSFLNMPKWKEWLCLGGQGGEFPRLRELYLGGCPKLIGALPNHLPLLTKLRIAGCGQLVAPLPRVPAIRELRTRSCNISGWKELPPLLQNFEIEGSDCLEYLLEEGMVKSNTCLQELSIRNCSFSRTLHRVCLPIALKSLEIHESKNLEFLLPEFFKCHFPFLERLEITRIYSKSLSCFPLSIFPRLTHFKISNVEGLESISFSVSEGDPTSLHTLSIWDCPNLVSIELPALNFSDCDISICNNLRSLLPSTASFLSLVVQHCPELIFPIQGLPSNLTSLTIFYCDQFTPQMELSLQGLASLKDFSIYSKSECLKTFPKERLLPTTLTSLLISSLPNLKSLDGKGLRLLTSLQRLNVRDCPKLQSLAEEKLPLSLSSLAIWDCPLLKDRCKFGKGKDWHHIAHVPHIVIDGLLLQPRLQSS